MGCDIARGFPIAGSPEERTGGRRRGKLHNHGVGRPAEDMVPRSTAPDRDGSASVASQVRIRTAGAYAPAGTHEAYDTKETLGAGHDPRYEPRDHGTQWYYGAQRHSVPPPSDDACGAPGEGALEWERSRLQSRSLLTPAALGGGVQAGIAPGGHALHTCEPPALHEMRKYIPRRDSSTPPRRTAGGGADTGGDLPSDKGDRYVDLDGTSHKPERRPGHAELTWTRAEIKRLRAQIQILRSRSRVQNPEALETSSRRQGCSSTR